MGSISTSPPITIGWSSSESSSSRTLFSESSVLPPWASDSKTLASLPPQRIFVSLDSVICTNGLL